MGSTQCIDNVASKVAKVKNSDYAIVVIVSAMAKETDRLLQLANALDPQCSGRELDALLASGEQASAALLAIALCQRNVSAISLSGAQARIQSDRIFNKARIQAIDDSVIRQHLKAGKVVVIAGFQGVDEEGNTTTFGRGGSDTSAVAIAAKLKAEECQIYTDVDGVYTTDPRLEPKARCLRQITFEEMLELASLGSKVLQIRAVEFAGKYNVPLRVLSSFADDNKGTLITYKEQDLEKAKIAGIACNRDEAQLTITKVPDRPGTAADILSAVAAENVEVDMIVQNVGVSNNAADFTFTVHRRDYEKTLESLKKVGEKLGADKVFGNNAIVKVSLVGVGMRSHAGIAAKMFRVLAQENINIHMISTSEIKISIVIDEANMKQAVNILHQAFELDTDNN